jgi:hypothetical protein
MHRFPWKPLKRTILFGIKNTQLIESYSKNIEKLADRPFTAAQCAQIVDAIAVADIPTRWNQQISTLNRTLADRDAVHDQQTREDQEDEIRYMREVRDTFNNAIVGLETAVKNLSNPMPVPCHANDNPKAHLEASEKIRCRINGLADDLSTRHNRLEEELLERKDLLVAVKAELEAVVTAQMFRLVPQQNPAIAEPTPKQPSDSSTSLVAACCAITWLPVVASNAVAMSLGQWTPAHEEHYQYDLAFANTSAMSPAQSVPSQSTYAFPTHFQAPSFSDLCQ